MARGFNRVFLIGNLGRDPELTYTPSGVAIAKFSLATGEVRKNQNGEWEEFTEWHNIKLFGKTAETASQYLTKGRHVFIEGRISTRTYEKDGQQMYFTEILGSEMRMLGGPRDDSGSGGAPREGGGYRQQPAMPGPVPPEPGAGSVPEDDLPF